MLPRLGRRASILSGVVLTLLASTATPLIGAPGSAAGGAPAASPASSSEGPGPAMVVPRSVRAAALKCSGDVDDPAHPPVLLVAGTALTAAENWEPTYQPVLRDRGHVVCTVELPAYATRDAQANSEFVATAIRTMATRSNRKISIIGHSQGAFLPQVALRTWPDLSAHVEDVIGIAGVYDRGSERLAARCSERCTPVFHQLATGSAFLSSIGQRRLPTGPSYTNVGTLGDLTVTPQPTANQQRGATSIMVEDVCPGRSIPAPEHAMIAGDNVALELTLDALDNAGAANLDRLNPAVCDTDQYPDFDSEEFLAATAMIGTRTGNRTADEPALYCRRRAACAHPRLRGYLTANTRYTIGRERVTIRTRVQLHGRIKVVLGGRIIERTVQPGLITLQVRRPAKRTQLLVKARPQHYTAWAAEDTKWIRPRRR